MIYVAWIPLFLLAERLRCRTCSYRVFNHALACCLVWNILGTWWICRAHLLGGMLIILANALCQAFCFWLSDRVAMILRLPLLLPFVLIWMGFEFFHEWWDLAWPWLNLGNALATALGAFLYLAPLAVLAASSVTRPQQSDLSQADMIRR